MRSAGLPIEVLIEYVSLFQKGDQTAETSKGLLIEQRRVLAEKMEELKTTIERLDNKIKIYDNLTAIKDKELRNNN